MAAKIRKGDKVVVLTGRDKGRNGEVIEMRPAEGRALVRGIHMVKRHQKQTRDAGRRHRLQGGVGASVEPGARRSEGRQADPRRIQDRGRQRRSASPSDRELRSMADKEDKKPEGGKGPKAEKAPQGRQGAEPEGRARREGEG